VAARRYLRGRTKMIAAMTAAAKRAARMRRGGAPERSL